MGLQPFKSPLLISLLVVRIGTDSVANDHQSSIDSALVLIFEKLGNILLGSMVGKLGQPHPQESLIHNFVDSKFFLNTAPVGLDEVPEQPSCFGVCCQVRCASMDILRGNLAGEQEFGELLDEFRVLRSSKRGDADFLSVDRVGRVEFLLQNVILLPSSFSDVNREDR